MATTYDIDIKLNVDDSELENASAGLQELETNAENVSEGMDSSATSAENASQAYQEAGASASEAGDEMTGMGDKAQEGASQVENSANSTSDSMSNLTDAMAGVASGLALESMVDTAGSIQDSWTRLDITFGGVTGDLKNSISDTANATGRSGSSIRGYYNAMGIAGIKNADLLNQSFQAVSGRAFQTGKDVNQLAGLVEKMALSGNAGARQLTMLGISTDDLGSAMGVAGGEASKAFKELSQEKRLEVLTKAMGNGKEANDAYKNSWEGIKEQAGNAFAGLMGAVGSTILPVVIPALNLAKDAINTLKDAFKGLSEPLQKFIGFAGAGALAIVALSGAMSVIGGIVGVLSGISLPLVAIVGGIALLIYGFEQLGEYMGWWSDFGSMIESVKNGVMRLWNAFIGSEIVQIQIKRIQALFEFLQPILSWIGDKFMSLFGDPGNNVDAVGAIIDAFTTVDQVMSTVAKTWDYFAGQAFNALMMIVTPIWNILSAWQGVYNGETSIFDAIGATLQNLFTLHTNILSLLFNFVSTIFNSLVTMVTGALTRLGGAIQTRLMSMVNIARSRATAFVNGIINNIRNLPSRFGSALDNVINVVTGWGSKLLNKGKEIIDQFKQTIQNGINQAYNFVTGGSSGFSSGFSGSSGFTGTGNTLNSTLNSTLANSSNNASVTNNYNLNGIIDKDASTYILDTLNDYTKKQNLIRGV